MSSFESETKISFPIKLANEHIIQKNSLFSAVVKKGPSGS